MNSARDVTGVVSGTGIRIAGFVSPAYVQDYHVITVDDVFCVSVIFIGFSGEVVGNVFNHIFRNVHIVILVFYNLGFSAVNQVGSVESLHVVCGISLTLEPVVHVFRIGIVHIVDDDFGILGNSGIIHHLLVIIFNGLAFILVRCYRVSDGIRREAYRILQVTASLCVPDGPAVVRIHTSGIHQNGAAVGVGHISFYFIGGCCGRILRLLRSRIYRFRIVHLYGDFAGVIFIVDIFDNRLEIIIIGERNGDIGSHGVRTSGNQFQIHGIHPSILVQGGCFDNPLFI